MATFASLTRRAAARASGPLAGARARFVAAVSDAAPGWERTLRASEHDLALLFPRASTREALPRHHETAPP